MYPTYVDLVGGFQATPSDATPLAQTCRAFWINDAAAAAVALILKDGTSVIISAQPGRVYYLTFTHVKATGTAALTVYVAY